MEDTFMTELKIKNVRHLNNISIPLSAEKRKTLILTGKNGSGKTSVLEALKEFLSYVVSKDFNSEEEIEDSIDRLKNEIKVENSYTFEILNAIEYYNKLKTNFEGAVAKFQSYYDLKKKYEKGEFVLAYYSDNRVIDVEIPKNIEKIDLETVYDINSHPSRQLVKYLVNLKTVEAFAKTNENEKRAEEIKIWFEKFENILRTIYDDETLTLEFNIDTFEFKINIKGREPFDFNSMSMGYAAVFDIIGDLIMRMESKHNYNIEGLVMIDEIETHLHVELQKKIVPILTELFPRIQFVLTTHSPFILNSAENSVVYDLESKKLVENGLTNLPYEGIVEGYFGSDRLSKKLRDKFEEYKKIAEKPELTDNDFARAAELEMYLDEVPDYLALDIATEYSRLKLELDNRG